MTCSRRCCLPADALFDSCLQLSFICADASPLVWPFVLTVMHPPLFPLLSVARRDKARPSSAESQYACLGVHKVLVHEPTPATQALCTHTITDTTLITQIMQNSCKITFTTCHTPASRRRGSYPASCNLRQFKIPHACMLIGKPPSSHLLDARTEMMPKTPASSPGVSSAVHYVHGS